MVEWLKQGGHIDALDKDGRGLLHSATNGGQLSVATATGADTLATAADARMCIICEEAPREVRFACGHATVCVGCLPQVLERCRKCPTCNVDFGAQPVAERGAHVRTAPTFVLPS